MYDPDIPRGYQDEDIDQAEFEALGQRSAELRRAGICTHSHQQSYTSTHRPDLKPNESECLECGVIRDKDELWEEHKELLE